VEGTVTGPVTSFQNAAGSVAERGKAANRAGRNRFMG
jgi:hypothetical protein